MKKRSLKKVLSLALSCALIVSSITVTNPEVKAATAEELATWVADAEYNLALNKTTTLYPGCGEGNQANLNNGVLGAGGAHCALSKTGWGWSDESYAIIDLGEYYDASSLDEIVIQYKDNASNDTVIGRSYKIEYSVDGVSYYDAVAETNVYAVPEEGEAEGLTLDENRCTTDDVSGVTGTVRYVRVYYPTTATYGIQITEVAVFAENPVTVEVEKCEDAAGVTLEASAYNTIKYNITAGEGQEDYVYMVYLDGTTLIGDKVSAGTDYEVTGIATGAHTVKVISYYDGKVSDGITSEEVTVTDISALITDTKNIANVNNNPDAKIIEVSDIYVDDNGTYTLEAAQVALNGLYPTGEGATVALRTAAGTTPVTITIDLGQYYRAAEIDKVMLAYSNARTYAATTTVEFSEDNETYTEVGSGSGYTCAIDGGGSADINAITLDAEKINNYPDAVRYVKLTLADGVSTWGYVINEIGVVLNTDTPVTGLTPKLNDIIIDTESANEVWVDVAATPGFEDAIYKAVLLDEDGVELGLEAELEYDEEEGIFWGYIEEVPKGNYKVKIVVSYDSGNKTIDKIIDGVAVENPKVEEIEYDAETANEIYLEWWITGYYEGQTYNIYLDGELYEANVECEEDEEMYTITDVPAGTHSVSVSVVIDEDESELCTVEGIAVNPAEIIADDIFAIGIYNAVHVSWVHELIDGEEAEYTVSLKGTDKSAVVEINEDGYFEYIFEDLPIGKYTAVITAVVNGVTISVECEDIQTDREYAVEPNAFKMFIYSEEELDPSTTEVLHFNDEEVEVTVSDMTYDAETKLYTYVKNLGKGTYVVSLEGIVELCTVEIEDVVAAPVTNLKATKVDKNVELTWEAADAPEGQTYTVYVNKVAKAEGLTDTKYTLTDVAAGDYAITVEAVYTNPYSSEVYRESADCEVKVEEETTTTPPTTAEPGADNPTTVAPPTTGKSDVSAVTVKKTKVKKATKKFAAKKAKLSIKKVKGAAGYQVQFSTTKKFKKVLVKKNVKKAKITIKSKKLKNKKKLFVRVKAYKLVNGKKVFAKKWSKAKKVKIKK